jgi:hypothetical protein
MLDTFKVVKQLLGKRTNHPDVVAFFAERKIKIPTFGERSRKTLNSVSERKTNVYYHFSTKVLNPNCYPVRIENKAFVAYFTGVSEAGNFDNNVFVPIEAEILSRDLYYYTKNTDGWYAYYGFLLRWAFESQFLSERTLAGNSASLKTFACFDMSPNQFIKVHMEDKIWSDDFLPEVGVFLYGYCNSPYFCLPEVYDCNYSFDVRSAFETHLTYSYSGQLPKRKGDELTPFDRMMDGVEDSAETYALIRPIIQKRWEDYNSMPVDINRNFEVWRETRSEILQHIF